MSSFDGTNSRLLSAFINALRVLPDFEPAFAGVWLDASVVVVGVRVGHHEFAREVLEVADSWGAECIIVWASFSTKELIAESTLAIGLIEADEDLIHSFVSSKLDFRENVVVLTFLAGTAVPRDLTRAPFRVVLTAGPMLTLG